MVRLQSLTIATLFATAVACGRAEERPSARNDAATPAESVAPPSTPAPTPFDTATPRDVVEPTTAAEIGPDTSEAETPPVAARPAAETRDTPAAEPSTAGQDPVRLLRRTAQIYASMSGLKAEFTMLTRNPLLGTRVTSHGMLYQRRPDRIRLDFTDPDGDAIVGDGQFFWVYYPSVDPTQVTKTPAAGTAGIVDLQAQFVGDPLTRFEHTVDGTEAVNGREAVSISLVPREDLGYQKLRIWIDTQDNLVRRFEITDPNGVTRLLDLRSLETNPALADSLFRFTPPPGTRVVERG